MVLVNILMFGFLIVFSAFFSSAETSLLSLNRIKLNLRAKKNKRAQLLKKILKKPDEFLSTILIGNNLVNIAAASISTILFSRIFVSNERMLLLVSTLVTTVIILLFAEILPKSYALRHNEKISSMYAYPIRFFNILFYPFVKATTFISGLFFRRSNAAVQREITAEEVKHLLSTEMSLFKLNPQYLRIINEIIDVAQRDIKSIMTPRLEIVAVDEQSSAAKLLDVIFKKNIGKVPVFRKNLDHITGIVHAKDILSLSVKRNITSVDLKQLAQEPIFISEYSSVHYALKKFKSNSQNLAIIIDEYGTTIGLLTLNDIFREILGEIDLKENPVRVLEKNVFLVKGYVPVEDVNAQFSLELPVKRDYATISGMFVYYFGKMPTEKSRLKLNGKTLEVVKMGLRKIDELKIIVEA